MIIDAAGERSEQAASLPKPRQQQRGLADQCVVLSMGSYPEPKDAVIRVNSEGAVVQADPDGVKASNPFEMKRRMRRVGLEQLKVLICELPNASR